MRISDWSSDVCSSDLTRSCAQSCSANALVSFTHSKHSPSTNNNTEFARCRINEKRLAGLRHSGTLSPRASRNSSIWIGSSGCQSISAYLGVLLYCPNQRANASRRSEEHTSELQSLMRNSYAVFCLKKKNKNLKSNYYAQIQQYIPST